MEDIFAKVDPDKRDRIINAAIEEFATYPYDKASTNNIVKNAGISKGLLFHYFNSKQELYDSLIGFVLNTMMDAIMGKIDWEERDLFERIKQIAIVKMEVGRRYPHMFNFIIKMLVNKQANDMERMIELYKKYDVDIQQILQDVYTRNVDYSMIRDQGNIAETINIVRWSLEKYAEEQLMLLDDNTQLNFEQAIEDMSHYMNILKKAFYKE